VVVACTCMACVQLQARVQQLQLSAHPHTPVLSASRAPALSALSLLSLAYASAEQVQELELSVDLRSLDKLLDFLSCSFMGGTDVDRPLQLSLERLQKDEWQQVRAGVCLYVCALLGGRWCGMQHWQLLPLQLCWAVDLAAAWPMLGAGTQKRLPPFPHTDSNLPCPPPPPPPNPLWCAG
jgi:hypothetical protein